MSGYIKGIEKEVNGKDGQYFYQKIREQLGGADVHYYCHVSWQETSCDATGNFWSKCVPRLLHLGKPEDVRIVFWFDN